MTEVGWLACEDPEPMLYWNRRKASDRKLILIGCASCRRKWECIWDARSRTALETMELAADALATVKELRQAARGASAALGDVDSDASEQRWWYVSQRATEAVWTICAVPTSERSLLEVLRLIRECVRFADDSDGPRAELNEQNAQATLIRDIFGNPFRPVSFDPAWRTSDVLLLAEGIYAERAFDRMPILADALQDAGCDNEEVLTHCRDTSLTHVRGCWVVDLLLGKA